MTNENRTSTHQYTATHKAVGGGGRGARTEKTTRDQLEGRNSERNKRGQHTRECNGHAYTHAPTHTIVVTVALFPDRIHSPRMEVCLNAQNTSRSHDVQDSLTGEDSTWRASTVG